MPEREGTILAYDGEEADIRLLDSQGDSARMEIEHPDGREWVVVVDEDGDLDVEVTRKDGTPTDLSVPEWLEDNISRMVRPA